MQDSLRHKKAQEAQISGHPPGPPFICAFCAFLWPFNLLRGGFRSLRLFPNGQTELELHVSLDLSQHFGIISQCLLRVFPTLAQPLAFEGKPSATLFHDSLGRSEIE